MEPILNPQVNFDGKFNPVRTGTDLQKGGFNNEPTCEGT
jgi:hypothetical protein